LTNLFAAITRLLCWALGFNYRRPHQRIFHGRAVAALKMWPPSRSGFFTERFCKAAFALVRAETRGGALHLAFSAAVSVLWAINFVSQTRPV